MEALPLVLHDAFHRDVAFPRIPRGRPCTLFCEHILRPSSFLWGDPSLPILGPFRSRRVPCHVGQEWASCQVRLAWMSYLIYSGNFPMLLADYNARNHTTTRYSSRSSVRALIAWDFDPVRRCLQLYLLHPASDLGLPSMTKDLLSEALKISMKIFSQCIGVRHHFWHQFCALELWLP